MNQFQSYLEHLGLSHNPNQSKYSQIGLHYEIHNDEIDGIYWFYETDDFIIDIHDFFVKKERIIEYANELSDYIPISSSYIVTANGESFTPYQPLTSNMMFIVNLKNKQYRFILHSNCPYLSIGINFKKRMLEKYLTCYQQLSDPSTSIIFFETRNQILKQLQEIAFTILNCTMTPPFAELFFEAKAKEWLSITLDAYTNQTSRKPLPKSDEYALENVTNYINDHYAFDISQKLLEKIAMMSGTKLKTTFHQKYGMSITEYIQRKRMSMAETLLLTTSLEIGDIAKAVGYISHSKFTTYFKKYKGVYPKDIRKMSKSIY